MLARLLFAVAGGLALAASFEPIAIAYLVPIGVAAFALATRDLPFWRSGLVGLAFGVAFYFTHIYWMRTSIGTDAWVALSTIEAGDIVGRFINYIEVPNEGGGGTDPCDFSAIDVCSFSAGAIDFVLNEHLATRGWLILPIGVVVGIVYYTLFRWAIRRFRIPTPGREEGSQLDEWAGDIPYRAPLILQAIGGKGNIVQMESCITRLRLKVSNEKVIDVNALRNLGAAGVIRLGGGHVQVVFGTFSELIREEMLKTIRRDQAQVSFHSPVQGRMIPLKEVPDPIFSGNLVGQGVAFLPERGELVSPVSGKVIHVYPTMHAIGIRTAEGLEVLLHIGIDTSQLSGKSYFEAMVKEGDKVTPGMLLIRFNLQKIRKASKSLATPMVITNSELVQSWSYAPFKSVKKGQSSVKSVVLKESNGGGETQ